MPLETDTCAVFHSTQRAYLEISVKCLSPGHNDVKPSTGVGYCPVGLPTDDRQRSSRQSTGPNTKKSKTN